MYTIHCHVKDTARLSSLPVGMIDFFKDDIGLDWASSRQILKIRYRKEYLNFPLLYSSDTMCFSYQHPICGRGEGFLLRN